MYRITIPCIRDTFTGTGDLFAALFLAWTSKTDNNVKVSLEKTQASLQAVLKRTMEHAKSEFALFFLICFLFTSFL